MSFGDLELDDRTEGTIRNRHQEKTRSWLNRVTICPSLPRWPVKRGTAGPLFGDCHIWCDKRTPQDDDEVKDNRRGWLSGCLGRHFSGPPHSPKTGLRTSAWRQLAFCYSAALIVFVLAESWYPLGRMCWGSLRLLRICLGDNFGLEKDYPPQHTHTHVLSRMEGGFTSTARCFCDSPVNEVPTNKSPWIGLGSTGLRRIDVEVP